MLLTLEEIDAALDRMALQSETRYRSLRHDACFAIARQHTKNRLGYVDINATYALYEIYKRQYDDMQILHEFLTLRLFDAQYSSDIDDCVCVILRRYLPSPASVEMLEEALAVLRWVRLEPGMFGTACGSQAQCSVCLGVVDFGARIIQLECDHWFHPMCILEWLHQKRSCPLCRQMILCS